MKSEKELRRTHLIGSAVKSCFVNNYRGNLRRPSKIKTGQSNRTIAVFTGIFLMLSGLSSLAYSENCKHSKTKSMMISDGLYPLSVTGSVTGNCEEPTMRVVVRYNSHMSKEVKYQTQGHPRSFFGFSLHRATPKQLYGMIDNMLKKFVRPKSVAELKGKSTCKVHISPAYLDGLIEWAVGPSY